MWLEDPETVTLFTSTDQKGQPYTLRVKFVRDNYQRWANSNEAGSAGKPFFVEESTDQQTHSIFFDDNLETEFSHIVAAYTTTGELFIQENRRGRSYEDLKDVHTFRVDPYFAITDPGYYIDALDVCIFNRSRGEQPRRRCEVCQG